MIHFMDNLNTSETFCKIELRQQKSMKSQWTPTLMIELNEHEIIQKKQNFRFKTSITSAPIKIHRQTLEIIDSLRENFHY